MLDHPFRQVLPRFVSPLLWLYGKLKVTPNQITLGALTLAIVAAYCVATGQLMIGLGVWWLGRLLDGTDGIYARSTNQTSAFGAFLDIGCDMASYGVMILGFAICFPQHEPQWQIILYLYILCITGALSLGAMAKETSVPEADNRGITLAAGLAEGGETGIAYTAFLLFPQQLAWLTWVWITILLTTVFARTLLARRLLGR